jgi:uncharacterized protein YllA (UPF0747 family)
MDNAGIPAPVYAALAALMMALTAFIQEVIRAKREKAAAEKVAHKVDQVKTDLQDKTEQTEKKLDGIATMGQRNHVLLNSNHLAQLKISAVALRRIADLTREESDNAAANLAERLLHEHEQKQQRLDVKDAKDAEDGAGDPERATL